jgi:hypothetical protein
MQEATLGVLVRTAGRLHDAVQGQKCIHDDPGHIFTSSLIDEQRPLESTLAWGEAQIIGRMHIGAELLCRGPA